MSERKREKESRFLSDVKINDGQFCNLCYPHESFMRGFVQFVNFHICVQHFLAFSFFSWFPSSRFLYVRVYCVSDFFFFCLSICSPYTCIYIWLGLFVCVAVCWQHPHSIRYEAKAQLPMNNAEMANNDDGQIEINENLSFIDCFVHWDFVVCSFQSRS